MNTFDHPDYDEKDFCSYCYNRVSTPHECEDCLTCSTNLESLGTEIEMELKN